MQPADLREKETPSAVRDRSSDGAEARRRPANSRSGGRPLGGRPSARGARRAERPIPLGRLPRALLAVIVVVLLVGLARATDVLALAKASSHRATGPLAAPAPADPSTTTVGSGQVKPLGALHSADVLLTADSTIPVDKIGDVSRLYGITATESFRYGTVELAGSHVPAYGVDPSSFRNWAVRATAASDGYWSSLARGEASASFQTAQDLALPLGGHVPVSARTSQDMRLGSFVTVGLPDAEAVLSDSRAAAIGLPAGSGLLISAPGSDLRVLTDALKAVLGTGVAVRPLKALPAAPTSAPVPQNDPSAPGPPPVVAGGSTYPANSGATMGTSTSTVAGGSSASVSAVLAAAESKIGAPYVYGASGPDSFDCSGFTSWVYRQVGVGLPRTADEQWLAGPHVSYADARPGDILAWAGDPSVPDYATHVAIYLGNGQMISAPHSGAPVGISSVYTSGLLGAVRILQ